jgi:hypothetical protein
MGPLNKLFKKCNILLLLLVAGIIGKMAAQSPTCGCIDFRDLVLNDTSCTFKFDMNFIRMQVGSNVCPLPGITIRVVDNPPPYGDTIDCSGTYTYGIFQGSNLVCWGRVKAIDKSSPKLTRWEGRCTTYGSIGTASANGQYLNASGVTILDTTMMPKDTFLCTDIQQIFNISSSWTLPANGIPGDYFAGRPIFQDACKFRFNSNLFCNCNTQVQVTDQIKYFPCPLPSTDSEWGGVWAQITRKFTATDCNGNKTSMTQLITFVRPPVQSLGKELSQYAGKIDAYGANAKLVNNKIIIDLNADSCKTLSINEMLESFKARFYIFNNSMVCDNNSDTDDYSYFENAVAAGFSKRWLECGYTFSTEIINIIPSYAAERKKVLLKVIFSDACTGVKSVLDDEIILQ